MVALTGGRSESVGEPAGEPAGQSTGQSTAVVAPDDPVPAVEVTNLSVRFRVGSALRARNRQTLTAVDDVSLAVARGETLGLVGESGSGKTTLGQAILRLVPSTGRIVFEGRPIDGASRREMRGHRKRMQVVFQDPYGSLDPRQKVAGILAEPLAVHQIATRGERPARVAELLDMVGLRPEHAERFPHQLSGGQRQRVAVARALAAQPSFIVCDEPLSALDVSIQAQLLNLLVDLRRRLGLTYLFIGHDLAVMRYVSDRIAVMYLGRIVETGPPERLFTGAAHPYTRALVSALPVADPEAERQRQRVVVAGELPSPIAPPPGCSFHSRCWLYEQLGRPERCRTERPELTATGPSPTGAALEQSAACHYSAELAGSPVGVIDSEPLHRRRIPKLVEEGS